MTLLAALGQLYIELGLNAQAADLERKRVNAARQLYGNNSIEVATALMDLAFAVNTRLDDPEWQRLLAEAESILDRRGETDSLLRAGLLIRLADYYQEKDMNKATSYADLESKAAIRKTVYWDIETKGNIRSTSFANLQSRGHIASCVYLINC